MICDGKEGYGFEFRFQYEDGGREVIVRDIRDADLPRIIETFESFLKAAGFALKGPIEVKEETE